MKRILILLTTLLIAFSMIGCKNRNNFKPITDEEAQEKLNNLKDYGVDLYQKVDYLPLLTSTIFSEQQSSYSRNGNNVDGFGMPGNISGEVSENNYVRPLLELNQPGVIYRMWFTNWSSMPRLRIYIDDEETPTYNITLTQMASGEVEPFVKPLVYNQQEASGGFVSIVPIVFKKSIKIIGTGDFYFNINYQKYPHGTILETDDVSQIELVKKIFDEAGNDPKIYQNDKTLMSAINLENNSSVTIYETNEKQTITNLSLKFDEFVTRTFDRTLIEDKGINIGRNTTVKFKLKVNNSNDNILRFKGVLLENNQEATVKIDDIQVSKIEFRARRINGFEWMDSNYYEDVDIVIPKNLLVGKKEVTITLQTTSDLTLYRAWMLFNNKEEDQVMFGDGKDKEKHNYQENKTSAPVVSTYEYDPNTRIDDLTWQDIYKDEDIINQVWIKITYKDQTGEAVYAPVSSFFGFGAYGMFETLGLMVGLKADGTMYCYYPMPFESGIKIELINLSNVDLNQVKVTVGYENNLFEKGTYGYFKTNYISHINKTATSLIHNEPITFLKIEGSGKVVGITHSASGSYFGLHSRFYLEGDEQIYIDGSMSHSFHGTGTEDFYNGGWYFRAGVKTTPTFGQSNHNYRDNRDRTVMIRTLITDPIVFRSEIDFKMEHGGWNERIDVDIHAVVYYYHSQSVLQRTDQINFNDDDSLTNHQYEMDSKSNFVATNTRYYEGYYHNKLTPYKKMSEITEFSQFSVDILAANDGVILRREYMMYPLNQMAKVYVDGIYVGLWQSAFRNGVGIYVRQDDFYIPSEFTAGKQKINIKIEVVLNSEASYWTESFYEIYSIKKGD
jgi:hypothetical protein